MYSLDSTMYYEHNKNKLSKLQVSQMKRENQYVLVYMDSLYIYICTIYVSFN
jgi:hypothetical protein